MATTTETLGLIQPETEDAFNVAHFNENMEAVDTFAETVTEEFAELDTDIDAVSEKLDDANTDIDSIHAKIGTAADTGSDTIFGKLNSNTSSVIKSIQYVYVPLTSSEDSKTVSINKVDTNKTFVIMERLRDNSTVLVQVSYTLNTNNLAVIADVSVNKELILGFWIIEFN